VWSSCEVESGSCIAAVGSPGESTRSWKRSRIRRAQPRCAVRPQKHRMLAEREGALWRYIQKLKTRAAFALVMAVSEAVAAVGELAKGAED
jgi:hypothetical protein